MVTLISDPLVWMCRSLVMKILADSSSSLVFLFMGSFLATSIVKMVSLVSDEDVKIIFIFIFNDSILNTPASIIEKPFFPMEFDKLASWTIPPFWQAKNFFVPQFILLLAG